MIASHHGTAEKGALISPAKPEAIILKLIDEIDAKADQCETVLSNTKDGTFSQNVFGLNNNKLYKPVA